jgi:tRNA threonylcarbamoyladenosine biosynthesis protein TsaE
VILICVSTEFFKFIITMPNKKKKITIITHSPRETVALGKEIAATLKRGDVIYLNGDLGSGKTVFAKGVCRGLGIVEEVTSPSFIIATEYKGRVPVSHVDLYRLDTNETVSLPIDEYLLDNGITIIEWADRIRDTDGLRITIEITGKDTREIAIEDFRD